MSAKTDYLRLGRAVAHRLPSWTLLRAAAMVFGASQIQASCTYAPPPVISQGQGADTLGGRRLALAAEIGRGTVASAWDATNLADVEVNSGIVGVGRIRYGINDEVDVGVVGGIGPLSTIVAGPEIKWRFANLAASSAEGAPGFHAALISGFAVGTSAFRYNLDPGADSKHVYIAPYTGITVSGGVELVQMFSGLRFATSETVGTDVKDLTLYPVLAFGAQLRPTHALAFYAEGDVAAGVTTHHLGDTALIVYPSLGARVTFDMR